MAMLFMVLPGILSLKFLAVVRFSASKAADFGIMCLTILNRTQKSLTTVAEIVKECGSVFRDLLELTIQSAGQIRDISETMK